MEMSIKKEQIIITISSFIILLIGLYMVKDSSSSWANYLYGDSLYYFKRQLIYSLISIFLFFVCYKINLEFLKKYSIFILTLTFLFLILVLIPGIGVKKNGSSSWLGFSFLSFQPSELFKLALIIFISKYLELIYNQSYKFKKLIPLLLIIGFGIVLIMLQPDFGTAMVLILSIVIMLFCSKLKIRYFVFFSILGIILLSLLIIKEPYRLERIFAFISPFDDPLGSGFQIIQSLYALGPGGLVGTSSSIQKNFFLPEPQNDFIFAIYIEEFGLLGGIFLLFLYSLIFYNSYSIIKKSFSYFKSYLSLGLLSLFMIQIIINLGVVISLFPVTGITLPLMSYGGTSLIVVSSSLGLIINNNYEKVFIS